LGDVVRVGQGGQLSAGMTTGLPSSVSIICTKDGLRVKQYHSWISKIQPGTLALVSLFEEHPGIIDEHSTP
jgi:hypothetical protein